MGGYGILSYFNISINKPFIFSSLGQTNCYASLNEEETQNIRAILFIMDRLSISLEGYHELAQVVKSLPRTHLIENMLKLWTVIGTLEGRQEQVKVQSCHFNFYFSMKFRSK